MTNSRADSKLTPDVHATIVDLTRKGRPIRVAAEAVGVHHGTVYDWLHRGEAGIEAYVPFMLDWKAARAEAVGGVIDSIADAGQRSSCPTCTCETPCVAPGDWKATAWLGERLYPDTLQLTQKVQIQQSVEQVLIAARSAVDDDGQRIVSEEAYGQFISALARVRRLDTARVGVATVIEAKRIGPG